MIQGVDNIGICASDVAKSVEFYERLGFEKKFENDLGCMMVAGTARLFVFHSGGQQAQGARRSLELRGSPPGFDHISFLVDDVDKSYREGKAKGVAFANEPADQAFGARSVAVRDPDGNNLYLLKWLGK
jgi:methylmalonyl-CoA/ethylmalonyl-CoA epimerase